MDQPSITSKTWDAAEANWENVVAGGVRQVCAFCQLSSKQCGYCTIDSHPCPLSAPNGCCEARYYRWGRHKTRDTAQRVLDFIRAKRREWEEAQQKRKEPKMSNMTIALRDGKPSVEGVPWETAPSGPARVVYRGFSGVVGDGDIVIIVYLRDWLHVADRVGMICPRFGTDVVHPDCTVRVEPLGACTLELAFSGNE